MTASLYRKYRPQTFDSLVGQDTIRNTLRNAIDQNKVSHAYLFCGPRGTGKTTTARILAKALLCEHGPTSHPDGTCEACEMIANGTHPDVYELDAASRTGVDNVREEIIGRVNFAPTMGRWKVYIIDEVHMLTTAAFNALLKTLEEPPDHVVFILCTTDPQQVPATIQSRCQRFDFHRISNEEIVSHLGSICVSEGVTFEPEALELIAQHSDGGMRNALTTLEQLMVFGAGNVTLANVESLLGSSTADDMTEIVEAIGQRDALRCLRWTSDFVEGGSDLAHFAVDLAEHIRNLYILSLAGDDAPIELTESMRAAMVSQLAYFSVDRLGRMLSILGDLLAELRKSTNPRLTFEIALTRMIHPDADLTLDSLAERIDTLERAVAALSSRAAVAAPVAAVPAPAAAPAVPAVAVAPASVAAASAPAVAVPTPAVAAPTHAAPASAAAVAHAPAATPAPAMGHHHHGGAHSASTPAGSVAEDQAAAHPIDMAIVEDATVPLTMPKPTSGKGALHNPATLQRTWQKAMSRLKKIKAAYGVLFMNVKIDTDGEYILATFPKSNTFAYNAAQNPDAYSALEQAVAEAFGVPIPVRFFKEKDASASSKEPLVTDTQAPMAAAVGVGKSSAAAAEHQVNPLKPLNSLVEIVAETPPAAPAFGFQVPHSEAAKAAGVEPATAPVPTMHAHAASAASGHSAAPAGYAPDDQVPYDDEYVPAGHDVSEGYYSEAASAAPASAASASEAAAPASAPASAMSAAASASATPAPASASAAPAAAASSTDSFDPLGEPDEDAIRTMLATSFGDGVVFKEVDN